MAKRKEYAVTAPMHNPPHPGGVLKDALKDMNLKITEAAKWLGVDRVTLSKIVNGKAAISTEMALRLAKALNTTPNLWLNMQQAFDLWQTKEKAQQTLRNIQPFSNFIHANF